MAGVDPFATAIELLAARGAGRVRASELADLYTRRIERHNGRLICRLVSLRTSSPIRS